MITIGGYGLLLWGEDMDWKLWILIVLWVFSIIEQLYVLVKKHKEDKANYRFLVCEQNGKSLTPIDCFNCEADARAHYVYRRDTVIIRITSSDLDWYQKHWNEV